jgi:hypothetical protein
MRPGDTGVLGAAGLDATGARHDNVLRMTGRGVTGRMARQLALACLLGAVVPCTEARAEEVGDGVPAAPARPAEARETFLAIFIGPATFPPRDVQATSKGILTPDLTVRQEVRFGGSEVFGLRLGTWLLPHLGGAVEISSTKARSDLVSLRYTTFSLVPMARLPLFRGGGEPKGRVYLYGGLALSAVLEGKGSASFPALGTTVSGSAGSGLGVQGRPASLGLGGLAGVGVNLGPVMLFAEYRATTVDLTFADLFQEIRARLDSRQAIVGGAARF